MSKLHFDDIPNLRQLSPSPPHPAHDLYNGQLLEPAGVITQGNDTLVNICYSCLQDLKSNGHKPPQYALANNLWIGRVPWQLQVLTFPEQLLIVLLYPQLFVFKLFPKKIGSVHDASTLQCGMHGNVSTYDMPQEGVVFEALQWLKKNNTKYYGDVEISSAQISELPENNIPQEIIGIVRQSTDMGVVDEESAGYVPNDEGDSEQLPAPTVPRDELCSNGAGSEETEATTEPRNEPLHSTEANSTETEEPDVIPLQVSGAIDTDMSKLTATELMSWGLSNLDFPPDKKHSAEAEENYNFFEKAFPCLFPYGEGGIEAVRLVKVDFGEHIRWALHYHDWRFRRHDTFPFVSFGILQQWQALGSTHLQMRRQTFDLNAKILSTITLEKLESAQKEEEKNVPISDPAIQLLKKHIYATGGHVMGSDQSRYQLGSQIWSTCIMLNPPSLWITINPCDLHDPIVQIFAGENINMDNIAATLNAPSKEK
ncbi:hypothetical protein EDB19DRAFT_1906543 [Suillus lakei]|nr:hypothetical protein EDB19DRAFT_1906543 [Suillus lakei]